MPETFSNNAATTLLASINNVVTALSVVDGSKFPASGNFRIKINNELMVCSARSGNNLTVIRGQEGTVGASHTAGDALSHILTAGALTQFKRDARLDVRLVGPTGSDAAYITDGVADEVQINQAIIDANASSQGVVKLLPGTYFIATPIELKSNVTLEGSGVGSTRVIVATGFDSANYYAVGVQGTETTSTSIPLTTSDANLGGQVLNLTAGAEFTAINPGDYLFLLADNAWETRTPSGRKVGEFVRVFAKGASDVTVYGTLRDTYTLANAARVYRMSFAENCGVRDLEIYQQDALNSVRTGNIPPMLAFQKARNAFIENCLIRDNDGPGITVLHSVSVRISNTEVRDLTNNTAQLRLGYGILIGGASEGVTVSGCTMSRMRHGVDSGPSRAPAAVSSNFGIPRGVSVIDNVVTHATNAAYSTHNEGEGWSFTGNVALNCLSYAFFMRARGCRIIGNTMSHCGGGIGIGDSSYSSSGGSGSGCQVVGNTIRHMRELTITAAMIADGTSASTYALGEGILLALTDNVIVSGNTIANCSRAGIRLRTGAVRNLVRGNTILDCNLRNASSVSAEAITIDGNFAGSVASLTFAAGTVTLTGGSSLGDAQVGRLITISGAATPGNNGTFTVLTVPGSTSLTYANASGATDANNGAIAYWVEGTTDNIIEGNFARNNPISLYDRGTVGRMKYLIRDYGTAGNVRNTYQNNIGIGMETGLLLIPNPNVFLVGNSSSEGTPVKTVATAPTDANYSAAPQAGTQAYDTVANVLYVRTSAANVWASVYDAANLAANLTWATNAVIPTLKQADNTTASASGQPTTIQAQNATGTASTGGDLFLASGTGTSNPGSIHMMIGSTSKWSIQANQYTMYNATLQWASNVAAPTINMGSTSIANGQNLSIQAQTSSFAGSTGGNLRLMTGSGVTTNGVVQIGVAGSTGIQITPSNSAASNYNVVAGATSVLFNQSSTAVASATGAAWTIRAQVASGTTSTGGDLILETGTGTSAPGRLRLRYGTTDGFVIDNGFASLKVAYSETSVISPSALSGSTNDYTPASLATARHVRQSCSAAATLTGLAAQSSGQKVALHNISTSAFTLTLNHEDGGSAAANRFILPGLANLSILAGASVELWYDTTSSRWRVIGRN